MNRRGVGLISIAHVVDDLYQGVVPALLPFLVAERHYSYAAAAGIVLAGTIFSSVAQPVFGWLGDRKARRWMIPTGMLVAAFGVSAVGLATDYLMTWLLVALSGIGLAAFHPEASRAARHAAGESNRATSVFAVGGNAGFALGPVIAVPLVVATGLQGTVLLIIPALVMAAILFARLGTVLDGRVGGRRPRVIRTGSDNWPAFLRLAVIVVIRSVVFVGFTSFLALYFIDDLGTTKVEGGMALTVFLTAGAVGTLVGGWASDRFGRLVSIRIGLALAGPTLAATVLSPTLPMALVFAALAGIALFMPFTVFVILGQDYLPNRIGTASGVTIGLATSVGGLFAPLLGWFADIGSIRATLMVLSCLPVVMLVLSAFLTHPKRPDDEGIRA